MDNSSSSRQPLTALQGISFILGILLIAWLALAPILAAIAGMSIFQYSPKSLEMLLGAIPQTGLAPKAIIGLVTILISFFLQGILFAPLWRFSHNRKDWEPFHAITGGMLAVSSYLAAWAIAALPFSENPTGTAILRLLLTVPLLIVFFRPLRRFAPAGIGKPPLSTLILALGIGAVLLFPWMVLGAFGSLQQTAEALVEALAYGLGEELLLRGVVTALLVRAIGRPRLGFLVGFIASLALQPGYILPLGDWLAPLRIANTIAIGLLATELAASGADRGNSHGSLWAAILAHTAFEFGYPGFVDSRMQFMLPHPAALESIGLALLLSMLLWLWRALSNWLIKNQSLALRLSASSLFAALALAGSTTGYLVEGNPGFTEDGFLILFREQADVSPARAIADRTERIAYVYRTLAETAARVQAPAGTELTRLGVEFRPHYLINMIEVKGRVDLVQAFASRPEVEKVVPNPNVRIIRYTEDMGLLADPAPGTGVEWNISAVGAPQVWKKGASGKGITIASPDSGVDWTHPALQSKYRGWNGGQVDHNYNWYDPWDGTASPWDDFGHGTHTLGTALGGDGANNQIGMAPGANWIACRNMRNGLGNPGAYLSCLEFFLAPFPHGGDPLRDGRPDLAAQIVNNSWGCPAQEGCSTDTLRRALDNLQSAGIMMVAAAGNDGPACGSAGTPPANYASAFTVGAVDLETNLAFFSSRGPVDSLIKPDLVAPGVGIRSSIYGGRYAVADGTSSAAPHVAGAIALLWSANPSLIGDLDRTAEILRRSAILVDMERACSATQARGFSCLCGADSSTVWPNDSFGFGMLDVYHAFLLSTEGER